VKGRTLKHAPLIEAIFEIKWQLQESVSLNITYRNPEAVEAFLAAHPKIPPFIETAVVPLS